MTCVVRPARDHDVMSYPEPHRKFWEAILDRYRCAEVDQVNAKFYVDATGPLTTTCGGSRAGPTVVPGSSRSPNVLAAAPDMVR
jgi:hypothetical protein